MPPDPTDSALAKAVAQIEASARSAPVIHAQFDEQTFTVSYAVHDPATRRAAIIDSVLDFDPASGRTCWDPPSNNHRENDGPPPY